MISIDLSVRGNLRGICACVREFAGSLCVSAGTRRFFARAGICGFYSFIPIPLKNSLSMVNTSVEYLSQNWNLQLKVTLDATWR